jgi:beta-glucosidase
MEFNNNFVWGVATSSYQIEGGNLKDGRGKNIWDEFSKWPNKVYNQHDGLIACDHVNRFKEDVKIMKNLGIKAYRFSISWPRILPNGTGQTNKQGLQFYHNLIDELLNSGIEPYITLYHWDLPLTLHRQGGWLNPNIISAFEQFATLVAKEFTPKVKNFFTLNEPQCFCGLGYVSAIHAPGWKLNYNDSFFLIHNALKAHGAATRALRDNAKGPIYIGYAPTSSPIIPKDNTKESIEIARQNYFDLPNLDEDYHFSTSLYSDPVILGDYPEAYYKKYKDYIPEITKDDLKLINQPLDYLGQNIYHGIKNFGFESNDPHTDLNWKIVPESLYWGPKFLYERYKLPIYITENGMANADTISLDGKVHDPQRIDYLNRYLLELKKAIKDGIDVRGYFLWSLLDNFEWSEGYRSRFGLVYVNYQNQKRILKDSAYWYSSVIKENGKNL